MLSVGAFASIHRWWKFQERAPVSLQMLLNPPSPPPFVFIGEFLDIMAVSCDSFNEETNRLIGRHQTGKDHVQCLQQVRQWCTKYRVAFKINTVVNTYNVDEDMTESIQELAPVRWKVS